MSSFIDAICNNEYKIQSICIIYRTNCCIFSYQYSCKCKSVSLLTCTSCEISNNAFKGVKSTPFRFVAIDQVT